MRGKKCQGNNWKNFFVELRQKKTVISLKPLRERVEERGVGGSNVMKMGVTTQLASQGKLSRNTSCVGYSTT